MRRKSEASIMMKRLVIFDVDGTLVDSQHIIHATLVETLARHGREPMDRAFMLGGVGLSLVPAMRRLFGPLAEDGLAVAAADTYREVFHGLRADPAHAEPLFPGTFEVVAQLRAEDGVVLGIATGKARRGIDHILDRFGWRDAFATVQTADDAPSKPDPGMVLQAMRATGVDAGATFVVGDTTYDIEMARAAGAFAIGVAWGNHTPDMLRDAGAHRIIDRFDDLAPVIDALTLVEVP
jgi:phosphoglycolate phosphatase